MTQTYSNPFLLEHELEKEAWVSSGVQWDAGTTPWLLEHQGAGPRAEPEGVGESEGCQNGRGLFVFALSWLGPDYFGGLEHVGVLGADLAPCAAIVADLIE